MAHTFTLLQAPYCGRDVERCLVEAEGAYYSEHYKPAGIPQATTPAVSVKRLTHAGFHPHLHEVPMEQRLGWLRSHFEQSSKPVALWTRATSKPLRYVPHYLHVVAVLRTAENGFIVLDPKKSSEPRTSDDTEVWSDDVMLTFWKNTPFSTTVPALTL